MRRVGKAIGYVLLGLLDAVVPTFLIVFLTLPTMTIGGSAAVLLVPIVAAGVGMSLGVVLGALAAWRHSQPFPLTRGTIRSVLEARDYR